MVALTACGGGSGGGNTNYNNNVPNTPTNPNTPTPPAPTTIAVSVDNSAETIGYVVSLGVLPDGSDYASALQQFQTMYNIGKGINTDPTEAELRTAYILAGGDEVAFNASTAQSFIASNYTSVLNNFFNQNGDEFVWTPKIQTINDINFYTTFHDKVKFSISDGQIVSVDIDDTKDIDNNGIVTWTYNNAADKFTTDDRYIYLLSDDVLDDILSNGGTSNDELYKLMSVSEMNVAQFKEHLLYRLNYICQELFGCSEANRTAITNIINNISTTDVSVAENRNVTADIVNLGASSGLSFADFGYITTNSTMTYNGLTFSDTSNDLFSGGYSMKEVEKPDQDMVFNGSAVAKVTSHSGEDESSMIAHTSDAHLRLNNGTETLTMNFSSGETPWYDVIITRTPSDPYDQSHNTIAINNTNGVNESIAENFRMNETMQNHAQENVTLNNTYYGNNGIANEVISSAGFLADKAHTTFDPNSTEMLQFESVFGGVKNE